MLNVIFMLNILPGIIALLPELIVGPLLFAGCVCDISTTQLLYRCIHGEYESILLGQIYVAGLGNWPELKWIMKHLFGY